MGCIAGEIQLWAYPQFIVNSWNFHAVSVVLFLCPNTMITWLALSQKGPSYLKVWHKSYTDRTLSFGGILDQHFVTFL